MTNAERRQYEAIHSIRLTLAALHEFHKYHISRNLADKFDMLGQALTAELDRIRQKAEEAEQARNNASKIGL